MVFSRAIPIDCYAYFSYNESTIKRKVDMSVADRVVLKRAVEVINDSSRVSEMWAGTLYEAQIENDKDKIIESLKGDDIEKIRTLVKGLNTFLVQAEHEYKTSDDR